MSAPALPRWLYLPALLGAALVALPLVGLLAHTPWGDFFELITSPASLSALGLSLRTAATSTAACLVLGVPLAMVLARGPRRLTRLARPLVLLPMVLPPVVGGLALLQAFGRRGLLGETFETLGVEIAFTTTAVVLAQTFVSLPFLVFSVEGALRSVGVRHEVAAATLGATPSVTFARITLPLLAPAVASGAVLAFARAIGEFGATMTFAGSLEGVTRTLSSEIYLQRESDPDAALALAVLLVAASAIVIATVFRAPARDRG